MKKTHFVSLNWLSKISTVACEFRTIKIDYSDYPKRFIDRINEVYVFSIKYRYSDILSRTHTLHLYSILWNVVTICFNAIKLAIVLAWFL